MHIQKPHKMSDIDWAECVQDLHFIRKLEKETSQPSL
jgi:hypothetical protein